MQDKLNKLFKLIYNVLKLNALFILLSISGLIVFGVGPAILSVIEVHRFYIQKNRRLSIKQIYQEHFLKQLKDGNILFYSWFLGLLVFGYNLYLGLQIQHIFVIFVVLFLVFILLFWLVFFYYLFEIKAKYEINIVDNYKLAFYSFTYALSPVVKLIILTVLVWLISYYYKGWLLFLTFGILFVFSHKILRPILEEIEWSLQGE